MKNNITIFSNCFGCGVCAISCPQKIIDIRLDYDGFYQPFIAELSRCLQCGICTDVCAFFHSDIITARKDGVIKSFACWSKNEETLYSTTSGGACYEFSKLAIERGYKVLGVEYDITTKRAQHYMASSVLDLEKSKKSKYIPSYTLTGYSTINRNDKFLVIDTPCHIDSLRRYIRRMNIEDNFLLIDFFCHGVPSMLLWDRYQEYVKRKTGYIEKVSWRNKTQEWDDSWENISKQKYYSKLNWHDSVRVKIWGDKGNFQFSKKEFDDLYFSFFLGDRCLSKACYDNCKFKAVSSSADIRVGDFWGKKYLDNNNGVSCVLSMSDRGDEFVSSLSKSCVLISHTIEEVIEGQMAENAKRAKSYYFVMSMLRNKFNIIFINYLSDIIDGKILLIVLFRKIKSILVRNKIYFDF